MLDKTIIVYYINVDNMDPRDVGDIIKNVQNLVKPSKEDAKKMIQYVIPVRNTPSKIECINNPIYFSHKSQVEKHKLEIKKLNSKLDRITSYINASNETRTVLSEKWIEYIN